MKKLLNLFLVFILTFLCSSCGCNKNDDLVVYKNFYDQDVTTFNYLITNQYNDDIRIANLIDGLVEHDKYGNIVPSIAKSWTSEIVDNKQIWTFYLKDNIYWSNYKGEIYDLVTAYDFVSSLKYSLNYNIKKDKNSIATSLIENALNYYNGTLVSNYNYQEILQTVSNLEINDPNNELYFYKNIKSVFEYCESNNCTTDFTSVGVKALDSATLQYTLSTPSPYFLSSLTNYTFLPVNENFIKQIGLNNFGTSKKTLLYNGGYLLNAYFASSKIEYIKNPNYWDKDNIFIDKLIFTKYTNYHSSSYNRILYEAGEIDEFAVRKDDSKGWSKYVVGEDGLGDENNPAGNNTYVKYKDSSFISYHLIFNQNRSNNSSILSDKEIALANNALSNLNFRKALSYGLSKDIYFSTEDSMISSIIPQSFINFNNKDYYEYFVQKYADNNNISYEAALIDLNGDSFYNFEKSNYYLDLAIKELNLNESQLPIKLEFSYYYDESYATYTKNKIEEWNRILNNCSTHSCTFNKIEIIYNDAIDSSYKYNKAINNKEYNLTFIGLYPDYNDPLAYLSNFGSNQDLFSFLNHSDSDYIDTKLSQINSLYNDEQLDERYKLCSELEYHIIFEENLLIPFSLKGSSYQVIVSNLVPYQKMNASYGNDPFKFKYRKIREKNYTQNEIKKLKEEYERNRLK